MKTYSIWSTDGQRITSVQGTSIEWLTTQSVIVVKDEGTPVAIISIANVAGVVLQ
jgi:hypothetical protein